MPDFRLKRMGMIMEPRAGEPNEVEGVLNPAAIRGPDKQLYLFPRLVARGNYSRIGLARVLFDANGDPNGGAGHDVVNCSIAALELSVSSPDAPARSLHSAHGAVYELGMRERDHGVPIAPFTDG